MSEVARLREERDVWKTRADALAEFIRRYNLVTPLEPKAELEHRANNWEGVVNLLIAQRDRYQEALRSYGDTAALADGAEMWERYLNGLSTEQLQELKEALAE